jgi:DNA-binding PadR family transcriptional regulator
MKNDSILGFALLGLLHQQAMSGYDLRKVFTSTAMGSFSDSPGAIYPALTRLEASGLARGTVEESASLRRRRVYKITAKGLAALKTWLKKPMTGDDVMRRVNDLMLRFAFMDEVLGADESIRFLRKYGEEIAGYVSSLKQYLDAHASGMPLSARLAVECGIQEYEARQRWATNAVEVYKEGKRNQV